MANEKRLKTCGDCIHADICKQVNGGWFSRENIAYCKGFVDKSNFVEVCRCKDCKHFYHSISSDRDGRCVQFGTYDTDPSVYLTDFCSYGERRTE
jgi:hypothetical protein